jgi:hypothetical protein
MDGHDDGEFGSFGQIALISVRDGIKRRLLPGLGRKIEGNIAFAALRRFRPNVQDGPAKLR